jgi:hypothetical protein
MLATVSDERTTILRMIDEKKITAEQGAQLLAALGKQAEGMPPLSSSSEKTKGRVFKVLVSDTVTGRSKVSVTLPLGLVRWGLKVGARYSGDLEGIDMDELADLITNEVQGQLVDVIDEEDGEHVQIFIE